MSNIDSLGRTKLNKRGSNRFGHGSSNINGGVAQEDNVGGAPSELQHGALAEGDYSKAKAPPNQIPIAQFWTFCETNFFRNLQDEDFKFLDDVVSFLSRVILRNLFSTSICIIILKYIYIKNRAMRLLHILPHF